MKRWIFVVGLTLLFLTNTAYGKTAPKKNAHAGKGAHQAKVQAEKAEPYKAYIVVEASSGKVLEGENANVKRPPASVTKLMVASIVMEKLTKGEIKLTDKITASKEASKIGGSQVYLKEPSI
jgi:D-alanyl-D-alanine carboxypeptidase (penicillin-binding protein 5/6)